MARPTQQQDDESFLVPLALALVAQPRANLQELARAIGISKATLYRSCRTREELIQRLMEHSVHALREGVRVADLENGPPLEALRRLIDHCLEHRALYAFVTYYWNDVAVNHGIAAGWESVMDAFFLRGQREGVFRIDISAPALTEICVTLISGIIDAEYRGRVARAGLATLIENAFLNGALAR